MDEMEEGGGGGVSRLSPLHCPPDPPTGAEQERVAAKASRGTAARSWRSLEAISQGRGERGGGCRSRALSPPLSTNLHALPFVCMRLVSRLQEVDTFI